MSRHDETIGRMPNPSQHFLEWNAEQKTFCYYSKEEEKSTPFPLPFTFLALKFMNSITGFDEHTRQGIFSNEVTDIRKEHFRVSRRDGSVVATGLYADIKDDLKKVGGKFTRSIYAITPKGVIVNIRLKGSQMVNLGVIEKFGNRWRDEFIQVVSYENKIYKQDDKEIEYTVPVFSFGGTLRPDDVQRADKAYALIKDYFTSKPAQSSAASSYARTVQPATTVAMPEPPVSNFASASDDDLPF